MKGLILKDLYNLSKQYKIVLILVVFYLVISLTNEDSSFFGGVVTILMVMQLVTAIAYDEKSKWDRYALAMPISRTDLVLSKYLLGGILLAIAFAANFIFGMASGSEPIETLIISVAMTGVGLLFMFLILPFLFKFGVEKGRYIAMLIFFIPTGVLVIVSKMGLQLPDEDFMSVFPVIGILVLILAGIISVSASLAIFKKKEV
ncbi:MAG TPA: ABC-2 transporter permease [Thermoclostridium sp.]